MSLWWPSKTSLIYIPHSIAIFGIHPWEKVPFWELWIQAGDCGDPVQSNTEKSPFETQVADSLTMVPTTDLGTALYPSEISYSPVWLVLSLAPYTKSPRRSHALRNKHTDMHPGCGYWSGPLTNASPSWPGSGSSWRWHHQENPSQEDQPATISKKDTILKSPEPGVRLKHPPGTQRWRRTVLEG